MDLPENSKILDNSTRGLHPDLKRAFLEVAIWGRRRLGGVRGANRIHRKLKHIHNVKKKTQNPVYI